MTVRIHYVTATGRIVRVTGEPDEPAEGHAVLVADAADPLCHYVAGEPAAIAPRPAPPALPEAAAGGLAFAALPDGSAVEIVGPLGSGPSVGTATADATGAVTVACPAPGLYQVTVTPPWPQQRLRARVPVAEGTAPEAAAQHVAMPLPIEALRAQALARVDAAADALARLIVTPGAAMPMIYLQKRDEAAAVLALPVPDDAPAATYRLVAAEAAVDGVTMGAAATTIATRALAFAAVGAIWDTLRLSAKRDIRAATTIAGIATAEAGVTRTAFEAALTSAGIDPAEVLEG